MTTHVNLLYLNGSSQLSDSEIADLKNAGFSLHVPENMHTILNLDTHIGDKFSFQVVDSIEHELAGLTIVPFDYQSVSLYKEGQVTPVGEIFDKKVEYILKNIKAENTVVLIYSSTEPFYQHNIPFIKILKEKFPNCTFVVSGNESSENAKNELKECGVTFVSKMWYLDYVFYRTFIQKKDSFIDFSTTTPENYKQYLPQKERKNKFLFTMRICRPHRLMLARLFENNQQLLNDTVYSRNFSIDNSFLREVKDSHDFLYMLSTLHDTVKTILTDDTILDKNKIDIVKKIFKSPIKLDLDAQLKNRPTPAWIFDHVEIVLVSGGEYDTNIIDEKQIIPMYFKKPFITVGGKGMYDMMSKLGFKTFDDCWDVSFDNQDSMFDRVKMFYELVTKLLNSSGIDFSRIRYKTKESIEHNYEHLVSGNFQRISNNTFFEEIVNAKSN